VLKGNSKPYLPRSCRIILAAEVNADAPDLGHLESRLDTTGRHLERQA
jgi:hypothetical protein